MKIHFETEDGEGNYIDIGKFGSLEEMKKFLDELRLDAKLIVTNIELDS